MKTTSKTLLSLVAFLFTMALSSNAQLKVQSNGDVIINLSNIVIHADAVEIHPNTTINNSNFTIITNQ